MKVFVSSRMYELFVERKIAIDAIHNAGHTPLYIETEPKETDQETKDSMDSLIAKADALVSIFYLSEGRLSDLLEDKEGAARTPIEYELLEFHKQKPDAPIFFINKEASYPDASPRLLGFFEKQARRMRVEIIHKFSESEKLGELLRTVLRNYPRDDYRAQSRNIILIRYAGPDYIGLIERMSKSIHKKYAMNIDYISHAAKGGQATLYMSCSSLDSLPNDSLIEHYLESEADDAYQKAIESGHLMKGAEHAPKRTINAKRQDNTPPPDWQFQLEVRTIDAPGQLNAVCELLKKKNFNIDELLLKPTEREFKRQTIMNFWLSKHDEIIACKERDDIDLDEYCQNQLFELESAIRMLVGVRAFSIRFFDSVCRKK